MKKLLLSSRKMPLWLLLLFGFGICVNNYVWWQAQSKSANTMHYEEAYAKLEGIANKVHSNCESVRVPNTVSGTAGETIGIDASSDYYATTSQPYPEENEDLPRSLDAEYYEMDVPPEYSQNSFMEHKQKRNTFFSVEKSSKLETISMLSATGGDLDLITEIISLEEDPKIRVAAVQRLTQQQNYAVTKTLLSALDDSSSEVVLGALKVMVSAGDRSIVPLLREKMLSKVEPGIQGAFAEAIDQLDLSVAMQFELDQAAPINQ